MYQSKDHCVALMNLKGLMTPEYNNQKTRVYRCNPHETPASQIVIIEMSKEINDQGPKSRKKLNPQGTTASKVQFSRDRRLKISVLKRPKPQEFNYQNNKDSKVQSSKEHCPNFSIPKRPTCQEFNHFKTKVQKFNLQETKASRVQSSKITKTRKSNHPKTTVPTLQVPKDQHVKSSIIPRPRSKS